MDSLPDEAISHIFVVSDTTRDFVHYATVSRRFATFVASDEVWRRKCERRFGIDQIPSNDHRALLKSKERNHCFPRHTDAQGNEKVFWREYYFLRLAMERVVETTNLLMPGLVQMRNDKQSRKKSNLKNQECIELLSLNPLMPVSELLEIVTTACNGWKSFFEAGLGPDIEEHSCGTLKCFLEVFLHLSAPSTLKTVTSQELDLIIQFLKRSPMFVIDDSICEFSNYVEDVPVVRRRIVTNLVSLEDGGIEASYLPDNSIHSAELALVFIQMLNDWVSEFGDQVRESINKKTMDMLFDFFARVCRCSYSQPPSDYSEPSNKKLKIREEKDADLVYTEEALRALWREQACSFFRSCSGLFCSDEDIPVPNKFISDADFSPLGDWRGAWTAITIISGLVESPYASSLNEKQLTKWVGIICDWGAVHIRAEVRELAVRVISGMLSSSDEVFLEQINSHSSKFVSTVLPLLSDQSSSVLEVAYAVMSQLMSTIQPDVMLANKDTIAQACAVVLNLPKDSAAAATYIDNNYGFICNALRGLAQACMSLPAILDGDYYEYFMVFVRQIVINPPPVEDLETFAEVVRAAVIFTSSAFVELPRHRWEGDLEMMVDYLRYLVSPPDNEDANQKRNTAGSTPLRLDESDTFIRGAWLRLVVAVGNKDATPFFNDFIEPECRILALPGPEAINDNEDDNFGAGDNEDDEEDADGPGQPIGGFDGGDNSELDGDGDEGDEDEDSEDDEIDVDEPDMMMDVNGGHDALDLHVTLKEEQMDRLLDFHKLGDNLVPFIPSMLNRLLSMMDYTISNKIRETVPTACSYLINCLKSCSSPEYGQCFERFALEIVKYLPVPTILLDCIGSRAQALATIMERCDRSLPILSDKSFAVSLDAACQKVVHSLQFSHTKIREKLSDPNPDLKEYKTIAIKELENCLLNVITLCSKALGCCLPFCDVVVKRLTACNPDKFPSRSDVDHVQGDPIGASEFLYELCAYGELVNSHAAIQVPEPHVDNLISLALSEIPSMSQVAVFILGSLVHRQSETTLDKRTLVACFTEVMKRPEKRWAPVRDNAVYAMCRVLFKLGTELSESEYVKAFDTFWSGLPLTDDEIETENVCKLLLEMIQRRERYLVNLKQVDFEKGEQGIVASCAAPGVTSETREALKVAWTSL